MEIQNCRIQIAANREELEHHGTPMFPCARYQCNLKELLNDEVPWHWHEEIELLQVIYGSLTLQLDHTTYIINEGEGAFINSGALHFCSIHQTDNCILNSFVFHPKLISGSLESAFKQRFVKPITTCDSIHCVFLSPKNPWHMEILETMNQGFSAYDNNLFGKELLVREKISHIWYLLLTNLIPLPKEVQIKESQDTIRVKAMLQFIHLNFTEPITVEQIANSAHLSTRECLRCFKKTLNTSPIQYLLKYRIGAAAHLLSTTNQTITSISNQTGFDSPSYFSKSFKKHMNQTPKEYRN